MNSFDRIIKTTINNHKRILIEEFLSSTNEQIKAFQTDDLAIEAIFDCLENPERDIEVRLEIIKISSRTNRNALFSNSSFSNR